MTMTRKDYLHLLDELLALPPGTLNGTEKLSDIPKWDSLAVLEFMGLLDHHFGLIIPVSKLMECRTIADLVALPQDKIV